MLRNMFRDASNVNRTKSNIKRNQKNLYPLEIPQGPWQEISIDIAGPLPNAIVVIVDQFTKII